MDDEAEVTLLCFLPQKIAFMVALGLVTTEHLEGEAPPRGRAGMGPLDGGGGRSAGIRPEQWVSGPPGQRAAPEGEQLLGGPPTASPGGQPRPLGRLRAGASWAGPLSCRAAPGALCLGCGSARPASDPRPLMPGVLREPQADGTWGPEPSGYRDPGYLPPPLQPDPRGCVLPRRVGGAMSETPACSRHRGIGVCRQRP